MIPNSIWDASPEKLKFLLEERWPDRVWKGNLIKGTLKIPQDCNMRKSMEDQISNSEFYFKYIESNFINRG